MFAPRGGELKVLDIEDCIITIDAIGCQTKIAESIIENGTDYILAVKENQKELHANIIDTFRFIKPEKITSYQDIDVGNGRVETRVCSITDNLDLLTNAVGWKDISTLVKIESQ
jgi:hypothetical protein